MTLPGQTYTLRELGRWRHRCPLCGHAIAGTHFKRHLAAHDRRHAPAVERGLAVPSTSRVWLAFLDGRLRA